MDRRHALWGIVVFALAALHSPAPAAQPGAQEVVIGLLDASERPERWAVFRQQLRDLGYVEGRNVKFEARYAKGNLDLLPAMAKELVQLKVAVIVTSGAAAAVAAQRVTRKIPIVMASGTDQVSLGLASNLARPGGNVTGVSSLTTDLVGKRFELMRELVPKSTRLAVLWHAENVQSMASVRDIENAAARSRIAFQSFGIRTAEELPEAFSRMTQERMDALIVINSPFIYVERRTIADLALKHKLPTICGAAAYVETGALLSYAPSYPDLFRHAANYVDKILKGANPADMPIEQPTTFELVINSKTARALGVAIPSTLRARADRVVE